MVTLEELEARVSRLEQRLRRYPDNLRAMTRARERVEKNTAVSVTCTLYMLILHLSRHREVNLEAFAKDLLEFDRRSERDMGESLIQCLLAHMIDQGLRPHDVVPFPFPPDRDPHGKD